MGTFNVTSSEKVKGCDDSREIQKIQTQSGSASAEQQNYLFAKESDVICGKGKAYTSHAGSRRFRNAIESYRQKYHEANTKQDKMKITKEIYESFCKSSSRFLKWNETLRNWDELTSLEARDKISHALRFANRGLDKSSHVNGRKKSKCSRHHRRSGSESSTSSGTTFSTIPELLEDNNKPIVSCFMDRQQFILSNIKSGYQEGRKSDSNYPSLLIDSRLLPDHISFVSPNEGDDDVLPDEIEPFFDNSDLELLMSL